MTNSSLAFQMFHNGIGVSEIAKKINVSKTTVYKYIDLEMDRFTGKVKRCVYEEDVTEVKEEAMKRVLKEYCKEHDGKFFTVYEEICRVKE